MFHFKAKNCRFYVFFMVGWVIKVKQRELILVIVSLLVLKLSINKGGMVKCS